MFVLYFSYVTVTLLLILSNYVLNSFNLKQNINKSTLTMFALYLTYVVETLLVLYLIPAIKTFRYCLQYTKSLSMFASYLTYVVETLLVLYLIPTIKTFGTCSLFFLLAGCDLLQRDNFETGIIPVLK